MGDMAENIVEKRYGKMKIMLVGLASDGHRKSYMNEIVRRITENTVNEVLILCPETCLNNFEATHKVILKTTFHEKRTFKSYLQMLNQIFHVAEEKDVDIVHFLEADEIYRYFGIGLRRFSSKKVVMTFHHLYTENWRNYAIQAIMRKVDCSVVHTKVLEQYYSKIVKKSWVKQIEYPVFDYDELEKMELSSAKQEFSLPTDKIIVGLLGGTLRYKGYNFLLDNLKNLDKEKYHFLFAGNERDYTYAQIKEALDKNGISGTLVLRHLTSHEFQCAIQASDVILLPYSKEFNGASGPLAEGVCAGKQIVGSDYGSLGNLIKDNHVGYTFEAENGSKLIQTLNEKVKRDFIYDETAREYQESLRPEKFGKAYLDVYQKLIEKRNGRKYEAT